MDERRFDLLVIDGPRRELRGFVDGWAAGQAWPPEELPRRILWPDDLHVRTESPAGKLVEALRPGAVAHVLVRRDTCDALLGALASHGGGLHLRARRPVRGARFDFEYEICTRPEGEAVRGLFASLPDGVELSPDYRPVEAVDPEAAGVELYAPAHEYVLRAHGTVHGSLAGVLQMHARVQQHERIRARDVRLDLEPDADL